MSESDQRRAIPGFDAYSVDCAGNVYEKAAGPKGATVERRVPDTGGFVMLHQATGLTRTARKMSVKALLKQVYPENTDQGSKKREETRPAEIPVTVDSSSKPSTNRKGVRAHGRSLSDAEEASDDTDDA